MVRISLRTKSLKEAIRRKKLLDLLKDNELITYKGKDIELLIEYETAEELREAMEQIAQLKIQEQVDKFTQLKQHIQHEATTEISKYDKITFDKLQEKYIAQATYDANVSAKTIEDYITTFNKLIDYFKKKDINSLSVQDIEAFKLHLSSQISKRTGKPIAKTTVNRHIIFTKQFLKFAKQRGYIAENIAEPVKLYNKKNVRKDKKKTENYTPKEISKILTYKHQESIYSQVYKLALYTGMRQGEIRKITQEDIKQDKETGIHYIDITEAKSEAGERQVPIHKDILDMVLSMSFPIFPEIPLENEEQRRNTIGKKLRYHLYKSFGNEKPDNKNFHTLRANFIDNIIEKNKNNPNQFTLTIIQEIVGHSKEDKKSLTLDRYKKGFTLADKKEIIDRVSY